MILVSQRSLAVDASLDEPVSRVVRFYLHFLVMTLVRDATAAFSQEMMHAAHKLNGPTFAHAILTTADVIAALPKAPDPKEGIQ